MKTVLLTVIVEVRSNSPHYYMAPHSYTDVSEVIVTDAQSLRKSIFNAHGRAREEAALDSECPVTALISQSASVDTLTMN